MLKEWKEEIPLMVDYKNREKEDTQILPPCPVARLRRIRDSTSNCNTCNNLGWYQYQNTQLLCSWYWDCFIPQYQDKIEKEREK